MFRKISLFIFLLFISAQNFGQEITINGNKFEKFGKEIFLNGINSPWQNEANFKIDFLGTSHFNQNFWVDEFDKMQANKVNFVRIWVHGRGNNTPAYNSNLKNRYI